MTAPATTSAAPTRVRHIVLWLTVGAYLITYMDRVVISWAVPSIQKKFGFSLVTMGWILSGVVGDLLGGTISDLWVKRTGELRLARRVVAVSGFFIAAVGVILATVASNPFVSVAYSCLGVFGLELTVGVSWAVTLDVGGDFAGSVSAVMNTCGNIGGAIAAAVSAYLAQAYGWNAPFLVVAVLCVIAGLLFLKIDAGRKIFASGPDQPAFLTGAAPLSQDPGS